MAVATLPVVVRLTTRANMNAGAAADIRGASGECEGAAHCGPTRWAVSKQTG